jgi:hypothetical protein
MPRQVHIRITGDDAQGAKTAHFDAISGLKRAQNAMFARARGQAAELSRSIDRAIEARFVRDLDASTDDRLN